MKQRSAIAQSLIICIISIISAFCTPAAAQVSLPISATDPAADTTFVYTDVLPPDTTPATVFTAVKPSPLVQLRYPVGYREVDLNLEGNARALNLLTRDIRAMRADGSPVALETYTFTSPDADNDIAATVASERAEALEALLASRDIITSGALRNIYCGVGWQQLARMIAGTDLPNRAQVTEIITATDTEIAASVSSRYSALIIKRLRSIDHGRAYTHILSHFYPLMRNMLIVASANDTARIFYRIGYDDMDLSHAGNGSRLNRILTDTTVTSITVSSIAEPAADNNIYRQIALARFNSLRKYISSNSTISSDSIHYSGYANGWSELHRFVERSNMPHRAEVISAISANGLPSVELRQLADRGRIRLLRKIDGGRTYAIMAERFFPVLRNTLLARAAASNDTVLAVEPSVLRSNESNNNTDSIVWGKWSFKSNLIYDALLSPSVEFEYHFNPSWSVALEYNMAWWKNTGDNRTYQLAVISPEARHYFSPRRSPNGHFAGVFGGFTWYDLAGHHSGHRGNGYFAGATYGYSFRVSDKVSLEAALGIGYLRASYKDYTVKDSHHVYRRTRNSGYFGPLKARLAIVWHFDTKVYRRKK